MIRFDVPGDPAPQGSLRHVGRGRLVYTERLRAWRWLVAWHGYRATSQTLTGPVGIAVAFRLDRPTGHYTTAKRQRLRAKAPPLPTPRRSGDLDKLARAALDGLTDGNVLADDAQVVTLTLTKRYVYDERPGALVSIHPHPPDPDVTGE